MRSPKTRSARLAAAALAAAAAGGPTLAQPDGRPSARLELAPTFAPADPQRSPPLSFVVSDRLTVLMSGGKLKSSGESFGRRTEGPAGRPANPKAARVGVVFRW